MRDGYSMPVFATLEEANESAARANKALVDFLSELSDTTNMEKTHNHPLFGDMNCVGWSIYLRVHDDQHVAQIEKIKAAEGYPA